MLPPNNGKEIGPFAQIATENSRSTKNLRSLLDKNDASFASLAAAFCRGFGASSFCTNMPIETMVELLEGQPSSEIAYTPLCFGGLHPEATKYLLSIDSNSTEFETVPVETSVGEVYLQRRR